jgi:hypothetical protein
LLLCSKDCVFGSPGNAELQHVPCSNFDDRTSGWIMTWAGFALLSDHGFSTAIRTAVIVKVPEKMTLPETSFTSKLPEPL